MMEKKQIVKDLSELAKKLGQDISVDDTAAEDVLALMKSEECNYKTALKYYFRDIVVDDMVSSLKAYQLEGVEMTVEDAERVISLVTEEGYPYKEALDRALNEIYEILR